jgi:hypothetical protein
MGFDPIAQPLRPSPEFTGTGDDMHGLLNENSSSPFQTEER